MSDESRTAESAYDFEAAEEREREAICQYLRHWAAYGASGYARYTLLAAADAVSRGEHHVK